MTTPSPQASSSPSTVIITLPNNITIRPLEHRDIPQQIIHLNDAETMKYLSNRIPQPVTQQSSEAWLAYCSNPDNWLPTGPYHAQAGQGKQAADVKKFPPFHTICHNDILIGGIGVTIQNDIYERTAELGYWLARPYWGQGIMSAVAPAFVQWAFDTFGCIWRIEGRVVEANEGSTRVLERAGLVREGVRRGAVWKKGVLANEVVLGICREQELGA